MKSKAERLKMQNDLLELREEVKKELMRLPNVVDVAIGLKETDDKLTDEIVFQVFVTEKLSENELQPQDVVPREIKGYKTDVIIIPKAVKRIDSSEHRPIKGGIQIANGKGHAGTLGCFARLVSDNSLVLLTNEHVLFSDGAVAGDKLGQPTLTRKCCCCCAYIEGEVGVILNPSFDNRSVDCAIASVNTGIATDIILNNSMTTGDRRILGVAVAVVGDLVTKVGRTSGVTIGIVNSITGLTSTKSDQIFIRPRETETYTETTNGKKAFSDLGDSGAVVLNDDSEIIGLLWGGDPDTYAVDETYACHINEVLDAFRNAGSEIQIELTPSSRSAGTVRTFTKPQRLDIDVRERLLQTAHGKTMVSLFDLHQKEVLNLVNHNRNVTVVWHRHQGPAFAAHIANSYKDPGYSIPQQVKGITLQQLLLKMAIALKENGSPGLKQAIETYALSIVEHSYGVKAFKDLLQKTEEMEEIFA